MSAYIVNDETISAIVKEFEIYGAFYEAEGYKKPNSIIISITDLRNSIGQHLLNQNYARGERFDYREKYDVYMPYRHGFNNDFFIATYSHWFPIPSIPKMGIVNEDKVRNKTMTNADKIIQLLQNPDENREEFNSLIPTVINCPMYIENNYDGLCNMTFCNMSTDSASCLECTKDWLYKKVKNEVLEV